MQHDQDRKDKCKQAGITLIEVPYWWNRVKTSLAATIAEVRPELISQADMLDPVTKRRVDPIPDEKPERSHPYHVSNPGKHIFSYSIRC